MSVEKAPEQFVITITRQFGSLGRQIAQKMSEELGIEFYDREIVDRVAQSMKLPTSVVIENEEAAEKRAVTPFLCMAYPLGRDATEIQDEIFAGQKMLIEELVAKDSCIVVGRCADFILSEHSNAIHIYIYAPYKDRVRNSIEELGLTEADAKCMIKRVDVARDSYHMNYSGFLPDDKHFKDVLINSSLLGIDGTAKYLADIVRHKFLLEK